jgi:hypothetical protein
MSIPTGWQNPKTNWAAADAPGPGDFNRVEGNINAIYAGARTVDPALAGAANTGTLRQFLSWIAGRIKAITGAVNWYDVPAITLAAAKTALDNLSAALTGHTGAAAGAHPATAISYAGSNTLAATNVEAALDELDAEKAGTGLANTFTERQAFQKGIQDGDSNQDVSVLMSLGIPIDTRSWVCTAWSPAGKPTHVDIKDGATTVGTLDITYDAGTLKPVTVIALAGGRTVTYNIGWDASGRATGFGKTVV